MTPARFRECLETIRWTEHTLARALECDLALVEAWASGEVEVPLKLGVWLKTLAIAHEACEEGRPRSLKGKRLRQ
ncbi:MAG: hypothetical protein ACTHJ3_01835 [Pararhizobium sp.]